MEHYCKCNDIRPCFGKVNGSCIILKTTYPTGKPCPFCKEAKDNKSKN